MKRNHVTIIVLHWRGPEHTAGCLDSLRAVDYPDCNVLVVDNGSPDDCESLIGEHLPAASLLKLHENQGYAGGNNAGIRRALQDGADAVVILNNDTVVAPDFITAFAAAASESVSPAFLGGKIFYHDHPTRIWAGRPVWDAKTCRFDYQWHDSIDPAPDEREPTEVSYVSGCAVYVTRGVLDDIGLMDPRFFCYYEEADWCYRALAAGYRNYYVPTAQVWHKVGASSGGGGSPLVRYFRTRNLMLFAERNLSLSARIRVFRNLVHDAHKRFSGQSLADRLHPRRAYWNLLTLKRDPMLQAWRRGIWDYSFRRFGDAPEKVRRLAR